MSRLSIGLLVCVLAGPVAISSQAAEAVDQLLEGYRQQGAGPFSAEAGQSFWNRDFDGNSCAACHTAEPTRVGEHQKTRKAIEPMAPSVNPARLTEVKQINKWFLRNCKGVLGRECSSQEKGDILTWLRAQ
ncbi:DUF1924 domain-containing protein [Marinobacterium sp. D7]|uniref:DUF1924 domain-containing protein n=1 Tax=Marinobacterium ramblicola TaxID=2849041 RepID=UPI001C2DEF81|nr:DUF1924 domain-containing protein [Marinobacterium ramblicola]MBV1789091.1 DUF1924 domain-containing protein [Marinobacterium ramblicola]